MKIAIVGAGISGLSCAWRLAPHHQVTLYEANAYFGGHSHTVQATVGAQTYPVDTGFLVFNHRTYPQLTRLFEQLGVSTVPSEMTFSVRVDDQQGAGFEWAGTNLNSVFAQRSNLLAADFWRMLADILRFNRLATTLAKGRGTGPAGQAGDESLGAFLQRHRFSEAFLRWYLLPMAAAIWSCPTATMLAFPVATFVQFCHNHGLLQVTDRPQWYTVQRGASQYVARLLQSITDQRLRQPVRAVRREASGAVLVSTEEGSERFDHVVLAAHSDQALGLLQDPSDEEARVLASIRYQPNRAVLHTDASVLPKRPRAWAAWNYQCATDAQSVSGHQVCVHYLLNKLQPLPFTRPLLLSLNPLRPPAPGCVLDEFTYAHPVFDVQAMLAQRAVPALQGQRRTWFAGAWTGYGFHEDGLASGLAVADALLAAASRQPRNLQGKSALGVAA